MLRLLPLPAAEVVKVLRVLLVVGEVVEIGRVGVTPGFKGQIGVHLIYAPEKTTHIITECIEINVINIINVLIT
jgi:hypothetical protein